MLLVWSGHTQIYTRNFAGRSKKEYLEGTMEDRILAAFTASNNCPQSTHTQSGLLIIPFPSILPHQAASVVADLESPVTQHTFSKC